LPYEGVNLFVGQAWTLTYEVMFYLAFAAVMFLPPRLGLALARAWLVALCVTLLGPEPMTVIEGHVGSPFVFEFLGGSVVARLAARGGLRGGRAALALGAVYVVAAMVVAHALIDQTWADAMAGQRTRVLVFGPPAVLFVYGLVALEGRWPVPRWLLRVGDASYSLYLLHTTVLGAAMSAGFLVPHARVPHLLWLAGTFAACLAVGLLGHRYVEKPLLNLAKRKKAKPAPGPDVIRFEPPVRVAA
jgi:exopolysaccharide production protein ExoZ